jgi:hypothetical protein
MIHVLKTNTTVGDIMIQVNMYLLPVLVQRRSSGSMLLSNYISIQHEKENCTVEVHIIIICDKTI